MQFKKILETKTTIDALVRMFGESEEFWKVRTSFEEFIRGKYTPEQITKPNFPNTRVPRDVIEAYRPLYDMYREHVRRTSGKKLKALP